MGLLDDLKTEVKKIKNEELQQDAELEAQEEFYNTHLRPVMLRANSYFAEIVDNLNTVAPEIYPAYQLDPLQQREITLNQGSYLYRADHVENPRRIDMSCNCTLVDAQEFYVRSKDAVDKYAALLDSYKFPYHSKNELDTRHEVINATFILEGPMKVLVRIQADAVDRCVYIDLQNIEDLPFKRYKFLPDKVDDELLDRLARLLVRKESKLVEVKLSDDVRDEFRRQLEQEKRRNEEELAEAHAYREAERLAEEEAKLINRAKRAVAGATGSVLRVFSRS
jgi:hypothetical protein